MLSNKNISVQALISKTQSSKSTIYRVMNGLQQPSDELMTKITEVLALAPFEIQQLHYYLSLSDMDENLVAARQEVYDLFFTKKTENNVQLELVYYEADQYIKSFQDILDNIVETSSMDDFSCSFRMINCYQNKILHPISDTINKLNQSEASFEVEHLINLSTFDFRENIHVLSHILPLLALKNYSIKYRDSSKLGCGGFFHDLMLLEYSYQDQGHKPVKKHLVITFLPDNLSSCYVVECENLLNLFDRNYDSIQKNYTPALTSLNYYDDFGMVFLQYEINYDLYLFKPSICYNRVPLEVWKSLTSRFQTENFLKMFLGDNYDPDRSVKHLEELLLFMETRLKASYIKKQVDIMSKKGLEDFAKTGYLLDHIKGLPPFDQKEIRSILNYIKSRDADEGDSYKMHLLKEGYSSDTLTIIVIKNHGLLMEYAAEITSYDSLPYCIFKHKGISNVFADFADNYIPDMMALPQDESHSFIDYLIETYC